MCNVRKSQRVSLFCLKKRCQLLLNPEENKNHCRKSQISKRLNPMHLCSLEPDFTFVCRQTGTGAEKWNSWNETWVLLKIRGWVKNYSRVSVFMKLTEDKVIMVQSNYPYFTFTITLYSNIFFILKTFNLNVSLQQWFDVWLWIMYHFGALPFTLLLITLNLREPHKESTESAKAKEALKQGSYTNLAQDSHWNGVTVSSDVTKEGQQEHKHLSKLLRNMK